MDKKTRLWEDAPADIRAEHDRTEVEAKWLTVQKARRFFACASCGAARGEACQPQPDEPYAQWRRDWDAHGARTRRWNQATDLERAMLDAVDDDN